MKIEKVNDHQIRCILTSEDLASRNIKLSELAYGSEKAKALFRDMMQQAAIDFGFEAEDIPLMIEAIPLSSEKIVLIVTKVESPDELDTRFSNFTPFEQMDEDDLDADLAEDGSELTSGSTDAFASHLLEELLQELRHGKNSVEDGEVASDTKEQRESSAASSDATRLFSFHDLDTAITLAHTLHGFYQGRNTLYKDPKNDSYYLIIHQSDHTMADFNRVNNLIASYLQPQKYSAGVQAYYEEHCRKLISGNAIQQLGAIQ